MENSSQKWGDLAVRALAIVGFIAVIGGGLWGSVSLAKAVPNAFSSLAAAIVSLTSVFVPAGEGITLSTPSLTVLSEETFALSWEHTQKNTEGSYTFRYDCADGVSFTSPTSSGAPAAVFCNTPFNFLNADDSITLTARSIKNRFIDVMLYVDFTPNGQNNPTVSGSMLLTIANENIGTSPSITGTTGTTTATTSRPSTTPRTPGTQTSGLYPLGGPTTTSDPNGFVDLSARVIELGVVDKVTGAFTASSSPNRIGSTYRVAVRFAIENLGTRTSGQWTFNAVLPTYPSHIFSSPSQPVLAPGDRIEFTLGFDSMIDANETTFTINVDPSSRINEPNKNNNILQYTVRTVK